jgi:hypothetical protein
VSSHSKGFSDHCAGSPKGEKCEKEIEKRKIIRTSTKPKGMSTEFRRHTQGLIFLLPHKLSPKMLKRHHINAGVTILNQRKKKLFTVPLVFPQDLEYGWKATVFQSKYYLFRTAGLFGLEGIILLQHVSTTLNFILLSEANWKQTKHWLSISKFSVEKLVKNVYFFHPFFH